MFQITRPPPAPFPASALRLPGPASHDQFWDDWAMMFLRVHALIIILMNSGSPVVANPKDSRQVRQYRISTELEKFLFSEELCLVLQKLLKYDYSLVISVSTGELREACQKELRRLQTLKNKEKIPRNLYLDNELAATAMQNQVRALAELIKLNEDSLKKLASPTKKQTGPSEQSRDNLLLRRYEGIEGQIQKNQGEVRIFMENEVLNKQEIDLQSCFDFFRRQARRLKHSSNEKLILSRAHLLDALSFCLRQALRLLHPDSNEAEPEEEEKQPASDSNDVDQHQGEPLSYQQINRWKRLASRALEEKLVELAGVCQQIPQLEAFNRTLQFSQLQNRQRVIFLRVVDVLISLHHRVSYLSRNKPQLLRELQNAQEELACLNSACQAFLHQLDQEIVEIVPLHFAAEVKKHNQLSEAFLQLRRHLIKMGEVIVSQDQFHTQTFDRADRLLQLVRMYMRALGGHDGAEWEQLVQSLAGDGEHAVSEEEYQLVMQLQDCLLEYQSKVIFIQQLEQQSTTKTNEELEEEVNKLISDYERLKAENKQHLDSLDLLTRVRQQLEMEIQERDNMIYNLSGLKVALEKRLANTEGATNQSAKVLEEELKKQQRETQKYLQSSLLLREQLKVSENQREKLLLLVESEKEKYLKMFEATSRLKPEKERLQLENEELQQKIEKMKNDHQRQINKLNKQINDVINERDLLEQELKTAEGNNSKLMDRLESNEKRISDYSKLVITRFEDREKDAPKQERDHRSEAEVGRLEGELEKCKRELERSKKDLESRRVEMDILERESSNYQHEISALKAKLKETRLGQEEAQEKDDLIRQLKAKLDKSTSRAAALLKELAEAREEEEQASGRNRLISKRLKELQASVSDLESQNSGLTQDLQQRNIQISDLQKTITSQSGQFNLEIKHLKEKNSKQEEDLKDRNEKIQSLQRKIERLQAELANKRSQGEDATRELAEVKIKQFETTIETHKLIEIKMEEQARSLKSQLEEKVEVEIKLNLEIDRLSKQIDRMKQQLEKFLRELTEKQLIIKMEREKYEEQVKVIREYEVKEKIQQEGLTPIRPSSGNKRREDDTPSHIDDRENNHNKRDSNDHNLGDSSILSKSNVKYDIYFNAKEYDRLQKEYNDFRASVTQKVEELERGLEEARRAKIDLEIKYSNLLIENKRITTSRTNNSANSNANIPANTGSTGNAGNTGSTGNAGNTGSNSDSTGIGNNMNAGVNATEVIELKKRTQSLENKLRQSNSSLIQYQQTIKNLNQKIIQLQQQLRNKDNQINDLKNKNTEDNQIKVQINKVSIRITELEANIVSLQKANQNLINENNRYRKASIQAQTVLKQKLILEQELAQAKALINTSTNTPNHAEIDKLKRTIQTLNEQISRFEKQKGRIDTDLSQSAKEKEQLVKERDQAVKERDLLRKQHDEIRKHLVEETKRVVLLEGELAKIKDELKSKETTIFELTSARKRIEQLQIQISSLKIELRVERERKTGGQDANVEYYLEKIRSLEQALLAVGDEFFDCKQALYRQFSKDKGQANIASSREYQLMLEDNHHLFNDNQYLTQANQQLTLQLEALLRCEAEWKAKERLYLQELEVVSRENVSLKDLMSKPSEKQITTNLPPKINLINLNYHEPNGDELRRERSRDFDELLRQMESIIEGRTRWEGGRIIESLQRWRVPIIVCKEIEDLLGYLTQAVELIKFLRVDYACLRSLSPDAILFENLLEFVFRVLVYFSEISTTSAEAGKIKAELAEAAKKYSGGIFFTVLQEFTIHILENNAIEEYKRELRTKAKELLDIKEKLDELITRQIEQEEQIVNRPHSHRSRDTTPYKESMNASPKPAK